MAWKDTLAGSWALVSLSLLLGLGVNHARGLPLPPARPYLGHARALNLADARRLQPTWIDARPAAEYRRGHIPGARSWPAAEPYPTRREVFSSEQALVAYCGPHCSMADQLAVRLRRAGYQRVYVLAGGLPAWTDPLRAGEEP